jgi:hypothetical protein
MIDQKLMFDGSHDYAEINARSNECFACFVGRNGFPGHPLFRLLSSIKNKNQHKYAGFATGSPVTSPIS